jgi:molybdenum cofactor cytidylyltransferase
MLQIQGKTLIQRIVEAALASELDRIVLVLGNQHETITRHLGQKYDPQQGQRIDPSRFSIVINRQYREGLSRSLCLGLDQVKDTHASVMFLLADQPLLDSSAINALLTAFAGSTKDICVPIHGKQRGNPTILSRRFYQPMMKMKGDTGARQIIRSSPSCVHFFHTKNPAYFFDIDTESDLSAWQTMIDPRRHVKKRR